MKVDFNSFRKQLVFAYERLADKLNNSIVDEPYTTDGSKVVQFGPERIADEMEALRGYIAVLAGMTDSNDPEIVDVYEELFPREGERRMVTYMEEQSANS